MNDFLLQNAWRQHQAGNFTEAKRLYDEVLRMNPKHLPALQMLGFLHFQRAEFGDAEKIMARALKLDPKSVDALYNRGCALQSLGRHKEALQSFDKAIDVKRDNAPAHFNRGNSLHELGRHSEALASYDRALSIHPSYGDALLNRGNTLLELKRPEEALVSYDRALRIDAKDAFLWNNRGEALAALGRHEEAIASFEKAIALQPRYAGDNVAHAHAYENRADSMERLGRGDEALADYERVLTIEPGNTSARHKRARLNVKRNEPEQALRLLDDLVRLAPKDGAALIARGVVLSSLDRDDDALADFDRALALDPTNADALSNRANTLIALKRHADALAATQKALMKDPLHSAALHNRGSALVGLRRHAEAIASFDKALAVKPDHAASWNGRGIALLWLRRYDDALTNFDTALGFNPAEADTLADRARVLSKLKRFDEAAESSERALFFRPDHESAQRELVHARLRACDWRGHAEQIETVAAALSAGRRAIHPFDALAISNAEFLNRVAAELYSQEDFPAEVPLWRGERYPHDKIRVGYLSTDFREHAVGFLIVGALEHHDKSRFETIGLSIGPDDRSENRARIVAAFDRFVELGGKSDVEAAEMLRQMEIDILVDLNGHTGDSRTGILARRPAPVQINYLGYPGTMGAAYIDYIIADRIVIPDDARAYYAENVAYLPDSYQANDSKRRISQKNMTRRDAGLPEHGFVFCSLSSSYKFAPEMFEVWMRLLRAAPGSVLWLLQDNDSATANLRREAESRGVAGDRLVFAPHAPPDEHLARQRLADLFLDTLPYNAHTTASDALWMGLPIVTCTGATFPSRVATSILLAAGLLELVTRSLAEYEALALTLARDADALAGVKARIAHARESFALFDTARFTRHLEAAYTVMRERQRRGLPPESFAVPNEQPR